jgi:hypothetical protein
MGDVTAQRNRLQSMRDELEELHTQWLDEGAPAMRWPWRRHYDRAAGEYREEWRRLRDMEKAALRAAMATATPAAPAGGEGG